MAAGENAARKRFSRQQAYCFDVRGFGEHIDEGDFFDGELRFECDEVASEA